MRTPRLIAAAVFPLMLAGAQPDPVLQAMREELERSRALRVIGVESPYFMQYALHDGESLHMSASLGALLDSRRLRYRLPRIQVRVGDYNFDNTNFIATDALSAPRYDVSPLPFDGDPLVLKRHLWLYTDSAYKGAAESIARKRAALQNVSVTDPLPDFWRATPLKLVAEPRLPDVNEAAWNARVRRLSSAFSAFPAVTASLVEFEVGRSVMYVANSEGTEVRAPETSVTFRVRASALAPDGMTVRDAVAIHALDPNSLPAEAELARAVGSAGANVTALAAAPLGESYSGPVLFDGVAGAQLMAQVLGGNLTVPRKPVTPPGRQFPVQSSELENRVSSRILPEWMDVSDDPTLKEWKGRRLFGWYAADLEGVAPAAVSLVEKGVLKNFLLTRLPVRGFERSNGHARLPGPFGAAWGGMGNMFVKASQAVPAAAMKQKLIEMCRERNKPYGIAVRKLDFPSTADFDELRRLYTAMLRGGSTRPVSSPILVYKVYLDGREELVRGLRFRGLGIRSLKDIVAASEESYPFDFLSNTAPLAAVGGASFAAETTVVSPALLVDDLELERPQEELPKPPVVPAPSL